MRAGTAAAVSGVLGAVLALAGCGAAGQEADRPLVGVAMPTTTSPRWIADGANVETQLEALGYAVDLEYAEDDIPTQVTQIERMIADGADALVIGAIDGSALTEVLASAGEKSIPIVSYDRLIVGSADVDYYVTFDNYKVGVQQGTSLLTGLGLLGADGSAGTATGPFHVELFAGSLDDNNAHVFWQGAMDTLQPFLDDGTLVVGSGQTTIEEAAILRWDGETAKTRMGEILASTYADGTRVDAVLSANDGLARGILAALSAGGYADDAMPVVTGQDSEVDSVRLLAQGVQFSSIFKDTRQLAEAAVSMVHTLLKGAEPEANDTTTYDNGVTVVPSYLLAPQLVTAENYRELLVDSGYYTAEELS